MDRSRKNIEDFLRQKSNEGQFQSVGEFTILESKAFEKLSEYGLEKKTFWILKAVQAAVAAGCSAMAVKLGRQSVEIEFPGAGFSLDEVANSLSSLSQETRLAVKELRVGLITLMSHHKFQLSDSEGEVLDWDGERLARGNCDERDHSAGLRLVVSTQGLMGSSLVNWFKRGREASEYQRLLERRACYAPLALSLDGRRISPESVPLDSRDLSSRFDSSAAPLLLSFGSETNSNQAGLSGVRTGGLMSKDCFLTFGESGPEIDTHLELTVRFVRRTTRFPSNLPVWKIRSEHLFGTRKIDFQDFTTVVTRFGVVCATSTKRGSQLGGRLQYSADLGRTDISGLAFSNEQNYLKEACSRLKTHKVPIDFLQRSLTEVSKSNSADLKKVSQAIEVFCKAWGL